jgi:hypothetical protein
MGGGGQGVKEGGGRGADGRGRGRDGHRHDKREQIYHPQNKPTISACPSFTTTLSSLFIPARFHTRCSQNSAGETAEQLAIKVGNQRAVTLLRAVVKAQFECGS